MASDPRKISDQPKLRTSCDQCGAAKVKCDRRQPACERCVSHGWACVYGVSRKMGKPPREKLRPRLSRTLRDRADTREAARTGSYSSGDAWEAVGSIIDRMGLDAIDGMFGDLNGPYLPTSPPLDFSEWAFADDFHDSHRSRNLQFGPIPTPESINFGTYPPTEPPTALFTPYESPPERNSYSGSPNLLAGLGGHDCPREAHEILRSLSFLNVSKAETTPSPGTGSASTSASASTAENIANQIPLDHVLRLNYEASERLSPLLTCSCARSPHLALLYAAIISRVLIWYQQAAGCTQSASWSDGTQDGTLSMLAVAPAKMVIGTFNVDDTRIQTALKMQLLSGEMKRAGRLIDQFTAPASGGESHFNSVDALYRSLHSWLRGEHSRINNMMGLRLRELNT